MRESIFKKDYTQARKEYENSMFYRMCLNEMKLFPGLSMADAVKKIAALYPDVHSRAIEQINII